MEAQLLHQCDILRSAASLESTNDLAYIEEQVDRIDNHIHQLRELKNSLRRHANYIRSPLYAIPIEVMSSIFCHVIDDSDLYRDWEPNEAERDWTPKRIGLGQILSLTSVSFHLRQVALKTPELWKRMFLELDNTKATRCISYARISSLFHVPAMTTVQEDDLITTALSSDIMHNVIVLRLQLSSARINLIGLKGKPRAGWWDPRIWEPMASVFPALTNLDICIQGRFSKLLLHSLPLSRLEIDAPDLEDISVPTSLQVLHLGRLPDNVTGSILYQCPNLIECINNNHRNTSHTTTFPRPLTLPHLKRLFWPAELGLENVASVENLEFPALEFLTVSGGYQATLEGTIKLCTRVSATLTEFFLMRNSQDGWFNLDVSQLFEIPLPHVKFMSISPPNVPEAIQAFLESQYSQNLPSLNVLKLRGLRNYIHPNFVPSTFIHLLKEQKRGGPRLHLDMRLVERGWTPELRKELKLIMSDGEVKILYNGKNIKWLEAEDLGPET